LARWEWHKPRPAGQAVWPWNDRYGDQDRADLGTQRGGRAYGTLGKTEVAYQRMTNARGDINGRNINLISLDDGYSPT